MIALIENGLKNGTMIKVDNGKLYYYAMEQVPGMESGSSETYHVEIVDDNDEFIFVEDIIVHPKDPKEDYVFTIENDSELGGTKCKIIR